MSSSSRGERVRSRGQVEPTVALAAALVVGLAMATFVGLYQGAQPEPTPPVTAELVTERVLVAATDGGVVRPASVSLAGVCPTGWSCNASLEWHDRSRSLGDPVPSASTARASRVVAVRIGPGRHRSGTLTVAVWR